MAKRSNTGSGPAMNGLTMRSNGRSSRSRSRNRRRERAAAMATATAASMRGPPKTMTGHARSLPSWASSACRDRRLQAVTHDSRSSSGPSGATRRSTTGDWRRDTASDRSGANARPRAGLRPIAKRSHRPECDQRSTNGSSACPTTASRTISWSRRRTDRSRRSQSRGMTRSRASASSSRWGRIRGTNDVACRRPCCVTGSGVIGSLTRPGAGVLGRGQHGVRGAVPVGGVQASGVPRPVPAAARLTLKVWRPYEPPASR